MILTCLLGVNTEAGEHSHSDMFVGHAGVCLLPPGIEYSDKSMSEARSSMATISSFTHNAQAYMQGHVLCQPIDEAVLWQRYTSQYRFIECFVKLKFALNLISINGEPIPHTSLHLVSCEKLPYSVTSVSCITSQNHITEYCNPSKNKSPFCRF